ncbi:MAG: glycosyltransferase family 4 protein [Verrucomicrobia bacterium]|nr:glycosyltransferase family 4 protein [Verrucomicrobiota bacterium]
MPSWPYEKSFGQQLRGLHLGRALQEIGDVNLVVVSDLDDADAFEKTAREFQLYCKVNVEPRPLRGLRDRVRWAFDPSFLNLWGCMAEEQARLRVCGSLQQFDLIWLNTLRVANQLGVWRWPRSVLDIDDVPSTFQLTQWRNDRRLAHRLKAGVRAIAFRQRERLFPERFTVLGVCSETDRRYLGGSSRIHVIPNGFERPPAEPQPAPAKPPRLGFIGLFSYEPNLEGIRWFMRECWPRIKREVPDVQLRLVGKDSDGPLRPAEPGVYGLGWMPDPSEEIATWSAMIVPIRLGAGTRVKVAEAFSRKCPLISTRLGAYGYDVVDGRELRLADTPSAFVQACVQLLRDPVQATAMAERAWKAFLEKWTWDAIAPRVWAAADHCLQLDTDLQAAGRTALR